MERNESVHPCFWSAFEVYLFEGMALGNIAGIFHEKHQGVRSQLNLGELLVLWVHEVSRQLQMEKEYQDMLRLAPDLRTEVQQLGIIFRALNVTNWIWYNTGMAYSKFRGIDVYCKYLSSSLWDHPEEVSWWIVNATRPWWQRPALSAADWWRCPDWVSYGQRPVYFNLDKQFEQCLQTVLLNPVQGVAITRSQYANNPDLLQAVIEEAVRRNPSMMLCDETHALMMGFLRESKQRIEEQYRRAMGNLGSIGGMIADGPPRPA